MRTLRFIVDDQIIKQDPNCDFTNLVPGSEGYLQAYFSFSPAWNGCAKVAAFYSTMGKEYQPQVIKDGLCLIPAEALAKKQFVIKVIGKKAGYKINTNFVTVTQDGGKV